MFGHDGGTPSLLVSTCFYGAFVVDLLIAWYAINLLRRMGSASHLAKVAVFTAASALVFGLHHLLEVAFVTEPHGLAIAESIEAFAALLLAGAVYQLYALTSD